MVKREFSTNSIFTSIIITEATELTMNEETVYVPTMSAADDTSTDPYSLTIGYASTPGTIDGGFYKIGQYGVEVGEFLALTPRAGTQPTGAPYGAMYYDSTDDAVYIKTSGSGWVAVNSGTFSGVDWKESVKDRDLNTPPVSPSYGDRYIVGSAGTGDWSGHNNEITEWMDMDTDAWVFTDLDEGQACWVEDENLVYAWTGTAWVQIGHDHQDVTTTASPSFNNLILTGGVLTGTNSTTMTIGTGGGVSGRTTFNGGVWATGFGHNGSIIINSHIADADSTLSLINSGTTGGTRVCNVIIDGGLTLGTALSDANIASSGIWSGKLTSSLTDGSIFIGNGSNVATSTVPNTGFNLVLGSGAGQVAEGNHGHSGYLSSTLTSTYIFIGNGSDIAEAMSTGTGFNRDFGSDEFSVCQGNDTRLSDARDPNSHPMDNTGVHSRTDTTTLNASTDFHGFLPKLSGTATQYLNGNGGWSTPANGFTAQDAIDAVEAGAPTMTSSILFANSVYRGLYFGEKFEDAAAHSGAWGYIRQSGSSGQLEIGSDDSVDFYETDSRVLAARFSTNSPITFYFHGIVTAGTENTTSGVVKLFTSDTVSAGGDIQFDGGDGSPMASTIWHVQRVDNSLKFIYGSTEKMRLDNDGSLHVVSINEDL